MSSCIICDAGMRGRNCAEESFAATGIPSNISRGDQGPCKDWQRPGCFQELLLSKIFISTWRQTHVTALDVLGIACDVVLCHWTPLNISIIHIWQEILVLKWKTHPNRKKICSLSFLLCGTFLYTAAVLCQWVAMTLFHKGLRYKFCYNILITTNKPTRYNYTHSFFTRIYFIRILRVKFAKFKEYFKNKPETEILKKVLFCVKNLCKCNQYNRMFLTKPLKLVLSLNGKTNKKPTTTELA